MKNEATNKFLDLRRDLHANDFAFVKNTPLGLERMSLMADATAAYSSVGVWEQLHCFFFVWGFPSALLPGSGLASAWRRRLRARARLPLPRPLLAKKKQWSCSHTPTEG